MGKLTVKSPQLLNFHTSSPVKERKIEILPDGEIFLQITYDDDTKLLLQTAKGSVHVSTNERLLLDSTQEKTDITVEKPDVIAQKTDVTVEKQAKQTTAKRKKRDTVNDK